MMGVKGKLDIVWGGSPRPLDFVVAAGRGDVIKWTRGNPPPEGSKCIIYIGPIREIPRKKTMNL